MNQTYTSQFGNTPQGNSLQQFNSVLNTPTPVSQGQVVQAQQNAMNYAQQLPGAVRQAGQQLYGQSGIPQTQNSIEALQKIFPIYLADQNLAQKYASSQAQNPNSQVYSMNPQNQGQVAGYQGPPNPYLNNPSTIVNALTQSSGQGFQGFTSPTLNTYAMGAVPQAATSEEQLLNSLVNQEQGLVNQATSDIAGQYGERSNTLNNIATVLSQIYNNQAGNPSQVGQQFMTIQNEVANMMANQGKQATAQDVYNYIQRNIPAYQAQGINPQDLINLYNQTYNKQAALGTSTGPTGGTTPVLAGTKKIASPIKLPTPKRNTKGQWVMPNGTVLAEPFNILGLAPFGGQVVDVGTQYQNLKGAGYSDPDIISYLEQSYGYKAQ